MSDFDLVIRNGTVVTAADTVICDVGVCGDIIEALGRKLGPGSREIDASGKLVLPGGVDSHCHMEQHSPQGLDTADDFHSGSIAAACGGNTTIMPFAIQFREQSALAAFEQYREAGTSKAIVDFGLHLILSDPTPDVLERELPALAQQGCNSWKIFTVFDSIRLNDGQILEVLSVAKKENALVLFHAENHDAVNWLTERLLSEGKVHTRYHEMSRPMAVEREAVHRVLTMAEIAESPVLIVHVSGAEALDEIVAARRRGVTAFAETCPHYLFLAAEDLDKPGIEGSKFMCAPPPRPRANQDLIWKGLERGDFDVFSSDHSPYRLSDKMRHGPNATFKQIPAGMPGLETRLHLLYAYGVRTGRINLNQFVALISTNAAKIYGLYPRKGTIAVGSDADLLIWDPEPEVTISQDKMHGRVDYTPYEGFLVKGWPRMTISRGNVVVDDGEVLAERGRGLYLPCGRPLARRP
jgi:dihydropyrimidinase